MDKKKFSRGQLQKYVLRLFNEYETLTLEQITNIVESDGWETGTGSVGSVLTRGVNDGLLARVDRGAYELTGAGEYYLDTGTRVETSLRRNENAIRKVVRVLPPRKLKSLLRLLEERAGIYGTTNRKNLAHIQYYKVFNDLKDVVRGKHE